MSERSNCGLCTLLKTRRLPKIHAERKVQLLSFVKKGSNTFFAQIIIHIGLDLKILCYIMLVSLRNFMSFDKYLICERHVFMFHYTLLLIPKITYTIYSFTVNKFHLYVIAHIFMIYLYVIK